MSKKPLKIGLVGCNRGTYLSPNFKLLGCEIVAICDFNKERLAESKKSIGYEVATYENFDDFIEHDMDAVLLANCFHEHAPLAIKCFEKGIHVLSECISNGTMAEGVELIEAFEKTENVVYMLAENYPQMLYNKEIQNVVKSGTLGKILYAEAEYNHPSSPYDVEFLKQFVNYPKHWRNYCPASYYITHSLGPVMKATGATPKQVSCLNIFAPTDEDKPSGNYAGDKASIITTMNDDGSVFRITACSQFGAHHCSTRVCGTKGQIENIRGMGEKIMLRYNGWDIPEGREEVNCYDPQWNDKDEELIKNSGHGGADFITIKIFVEAVKANKQPPFPFDIYSGTTMSSVAILGHRSMLEGGKPYMIPDFRKKEDRDLWREDRLTPFFGTNGSKPNIQPGSQADYKPTEEQIAGYKKLIGIE